MPKKFNQKAGNHWRIDPENVDFADFQAKSRSYLLKDFSKYEHPKGQNGHQFVYKPQNSCIEEAHMVCATTL